MFATRPLHLRSRPVRRARQSITGVFGRLVPNETEKRFDIEIIGDASDADLAAATTGTVRGSELVWQIKDETFHVPIATLRGDYRLRMERAGTGCAAGRRVTSLHGLMTFSRSVFSASNGFQKGL